MTYYNRKKVSVVLYMVIAYVTAILVVGNYFAFSYAPLISQTLGQSMYETVESADGSAMDSDYYKMTYNSMDELIADETDYAHQVQEEGSVLLQNSGLPVAAGSSVTLLGIGSTNAFFYAGGSGSGAVNDSRAVEIDTQFKNAGYNVNDTAVNYFKTLTADPTASEIPQDVKDSFTQYSDMGIVFIGRAGGESRDLTLADAQLTENEKSLIDLAIENFDTTVVVLNTMNPMELGYLDGKDVSVLWIGGTGEVMIGAVPEILNGTRNPSGKLVDTYAYDIMSAPAMMNFGDINLTGTPEDGLADKYVNYAEGIYVGYRYYETRYADVVMGTSGAGAYDYAATVQYPFGYGLSYTTFAYSDFTMAENGDQFDLSVTVTNTGDVAGKEAVEFYMQSPYTEYDIQNGVEKSAVQLVDFAKTEVLQPGESQTVSVQVDKEVMKAYDAATAKTYIVDDGDYYFATGENAHAALNNILAAQGYDETAGMTAAGDASLTDVYHQDAFDAETYSVAETGEKVTNQFDDAALDAYYDDQAYLTRSDWEGTMPQQGTELAATDEMLSYLNQPAVMDESAEMPQTGVDNGIMLADTLSWGEDGKVTVRDYDDEIWDQILDELQPQDMMDMVAIGGYGTLAIGEPVNKPGTVDADGPAGFGGMVMGGISTFGYPAEIVLASTWNKELAADMGFYIGEDGLFSGRTAWYAPAVNIHRTPLSGRNFEYYSEDPALSALMVSEVTKAAQDKGVLCYVKHFALNDQETNRSVVCTFATEQSIREIYLYPFEKAVTDGKALGLMNSQNRIGMIWAGSHKGLLTNVLRNEWGFHGVVITDAVLSQNAKNEPSATILAGTDLFLCTNKGVFEIPDFASNATVMNGLREACHRILFSYAQSSAMNGLSSNTKLVTVTPMWEKALVGVDVALGVIMIAGVILLTRGLVKGKKKEEAGKNA